MNKKLKIPIAIALILLFLANCAPVSRCDYGGGPLIHNRKDLRP